MATVAVQERLFSLVLALLASTAGLTKTQILSTVHGYRQRYRPEGNPSLERQFERDKEDIRQLGVPLETVESPLDPGNNQTLRYRIPKGEYNLPADITFSPQEVGLLGLAALVWREGSLSADSRRALLKLRSLGIETDDPMLGYAPRLRSRELAFGPLNAAIERRQVVSFPYLKPGDTAGRQRTVLPLALVQHEGRWHVAGVDQDTGQHRTFLLSRIVGPVRTSPKPGRTPPAEEEIGDSATQVLTELEAIFLSNVAELSVTAGSDAATRLAHRARANLPAVRQSTTGTDRLLVHYTDTALLADELTSYGPEVLVHGPASLRDAVRDRLLAVAAAHGADPPETVAPS